MDSHWIKWTPRKMFSFFHFTSTDTSNSNRKQLVSGITTLNNNNKIIPTIVDNVSTTIITTANNNTDNVTSNINNNHVNSYESCYSQPKRQVSL